MRFNIETAAKIITMRGNSGYLRCISHTALTLAVILLLLCTVAPTEAGPTRSRRQIITSMDIADNAQSLEKCMMNGKEELRSSVQCLPKPGCRKIEIRDECCPLYKCDCQFNDKTFENNEKISDPSTPCHVCLCRGGEIKCTNVTCYNRNDCANTTYVEGVCCPQYDNCPPLEDNNLGASKDSVPAADTPISVATKTAFTKEQLLATTTTASTRTTETPSQAPINDNPLGIKIKEITKPEEIRITDDKPKLFKPPTRTTPTTGSAEQFSASSTMVPKSAPHSYDIIEPEDESSGGAEFPSEHVDDEILPEMTSSGDSESVAETIGDNIDDLSQFENSGDQFTESSGVKSIRQTEQIDTIVEPSSAEVIVSDKLLNLLQTSSGILSSSDVIDEALSTSTTAAPNSASVETTENSQLIYIKGKPFKIREADGLTRGNDDEDIEPKAGRKPNTNADNNIFTTIASIVEEAEASSMSSLVSSTQSSVTSDGEGSGSSLVFETEYNYPSEGSAELSSEVFDSSETIKPLASTVFSPQNSLPDLSSQEYIKVPSSGGSVDEFDDSGSADGNGLYTEETELELEGSTPVDASVSSSSSQSSSTVVTLAVESSSASPPPHDSTDGPTDKSSAASAASAQQVISNETTASNNDNDDKTREFPEQSDDYSVHCRMQNEDLAKSSNTAALTADDTDNALADTLRVIPIARTTESADTSSEPADEQQRSSYSDVQERSPGEPFLIPEWERNATTEATLPAKINRKDSLILLPVNDDADFGRSAASSAASATNDVQAEQSTSTVSVSDEISLPEVGLPLADGSTTTSAAHLMVNEVVGGGSSEARSLDDGYDGFGSSKLKHLFRVPGEFFRYQDKIMNS